MRQKTHTMALIFIKNFFADRELTQKNNYSETIPRTRVFRCLGGGGGVN